MVYRWRLVRFGVAGLLLLAAVMKAAQFVFEPPTVGRFLDSQWIAFGVVQVELAVSAWLISGFRPRAAWRLSLCLFVGFMAVSAYKITSRHESCGCFGSVRVSPVATAMLDAAVLVGLVAWRPPPEGARVSRSWWIGSLTGWTVLSGVVIALFGVTRPARLNADGGIDQQQGLVVLEPESWLGQRLPLIPYIRGLNDLDGGKWLVLLHRRGCPQCESTINDLSRRVAAGQVDWRVGLVELPSDARTGQGIPVGCPGCQVGHLDRSRDWFAETPVALELIDGTVVRITHPARHDQER